MASPAGSPLIPESMRKIYEFNRITQPLITALEKVQERQARGIYLRSCGDDEEPCWGRDSPQMTPTPSPSPSPVKILTTPPLAHLHCTSTHNSTKAPAVMPCPSTQGRHLCSMCRKTAIIICQTCHCSRYCSQECQQSDWRTHKLVCSSFKAILQVSPPHPDSYRAIFFDVYKNNPEWVWVRMTPLPDISGFNIKIDSVPQDQAQLLQAIAHTKHNPVLDRDHATIQCLGCVQSDTANMPHPGCMPNPSAASISPELLHLVKGPVLFAGCGTHLDTTSFRHIADRWLMEHAKAHEAAVEGHGPGVCVSILLSPRAARYLLMPSMSSSHNAKHKEEKTERNQMAYEAHQVPYIVKGDAIPPYRSLIASFCAHSSKKRAKSSLPAICIRFAFCA